MMERIGPRLVYGMRNDQSVHVSELAAEEGGARCGCVCPACEDLLIAKRGETLAHHFAHASGAECASAGESGLHLRAKELVARTRCVTLPALVARDSATVASSWYGVEADGRAHDKAVIVKGPAQITLDTAELEQWAGGFRPDVTGVYCGRRLFIEIRVTHAVDKVKREKIAQAGVSCLEINLSRANVMAAPAELEDMLADATRWQWLHHIQRARVEAELAQRVYREAQVKAQQNAQQAHEHEKWLRISATERRLQQQQACFDDVPPAHQSNLEELEEHDAPNWIGHWPDDDLEPPTMPYPQASTLSGRFPR